MSNTRNPRFPGSPSPHPGMIKMVYIAGLLLLAISSAAAGPVFSVMTTTLSLGSNGSLTYTVTGQFMNCTGSQTATFRIWSYTDFVYTDPSGFQHSLSGTADYIITGPGAQICTQTGSYPATLVGNGYTIVVTPSSGGGATAVFHR